MDDLKKPAEKYFFDFSTLDGPGLHAVGASLFYEVLPEGMEGIRIDLADHPLYEKLERYVLANPSRKNRR